MANVGEVFTARFGKPDPPAPSGLRFGDHPAAGLIWEEFHRQVGAGWYLDRFLYLFGEGLDALLPCVEAWSFLTGPPKERMVVGRNAYGALLVADEPSKEGMSCRVHLLDPVTVRWWTDPDLDLSGLVGYWLPNDQLPGFLDDELYRAMRTAAGITLELNEALAPRTPKPLGGKIEADNFQVEDIVAYYRTTGPIYAKALGKKT